jgi:two-component system response regulator MprA
VGLGRFDHDARTGKPASALLLPGSSRVRLDRRIRQRGGSGTGRASIAHYPQTVSLPARSTPSQPVRRSEEGAARVLVVEDEPALYAGLRTALELEGYDVEVATDGAEALEVLAARPADAVVLDVLMPRLDGVEVCRRLRAARNPVPILMLTARAEIENRVEGLDAGADDYVVKPFALDELFARLRALLRRTGDASDGEALSFGDLELDPATREVHRGRRPIELTRTEFGLLELFLRNPRQVLTRSVIFERVWGYDFGSSSNSLDVYIGYLRRKTEAGGEPRVIQTVRGVGYALREA